MPISNASKSTSPLAYPGTTVPDYNFSNRPYEPLGSKDTFLSKSGLFGWGSTYYDKGFSPYRSQQDQRYYNQSGVTWLGNTLASIGLKTFAVGVPSLAGSLTSLAASPLAAFSDSLTQQDIYSGNPLNQLSSAIDAQVNALAYLPTREDFNSLDFVKSLTRPTEMISQNVDSLAFLAQSFVGAGALAELNIGPKLATRLAKFSPMYEELTALKGPNVAGMADRINTITTNALLTTNEAALEAKDAYGTLTERLHQDRLAGKNNLTDDEIKHRGDKASYNVFWQNVATGAVLNIPFVNLMKSFSPAKEVATRANEYGLKLLGNTIKAPEYLTKFEKFLFDKGYTPGMFTKSLLEQGFSEGLEEALQQSIQVVNQLDNVPDDFTASSKRYIDEIISGQTLDLSNRDRGMAFGLGALMGMGSTVVASALGKGPVGEARDFAKNREKYVQSLNSSYSTLYNNSIASKSPDVETKVYATTENGQTKYYAETPEAKTELQPDEFKQLTAVHNLNPNTGGVFTTPGTIQLTDDGQPVVNPHKIAKLASDAVVFDELSDLISRETLSGNPDELKLKLLRNETIAKAATNYLQAGAYDIFLDRLESLQNGSPTEFAQLGIADPTTAKQEIARLIDFAKGLEHLYLTTNNSTPITSTSKTDLELNELRKQELFNKGQRLLTLDSLIEDVRQQALDASSKLLPTYGQEFVDTAKKLANQKFSEETTQLLNSIDASKLSTKELESLPEFKDAEQIASNPDGRKLLDLAIKERNLIDSRRELGKVFDSLVTPGGFKLFKANKGKFTTSSTLQELKIDAALNPQKYNAYELRQVKTQEYHSKMDLVAREFYSEYLHEFFKYFDPQDVPVDKAVKTRQVVERILEKHPFLYEEDARALASMVQQQVDSYQSLETTLRQQASDNSIDYDDSYVIFEDNVEVQDALLDEIAKAKDLKEALGSLLDSETIPRILSLTAPLSVPSNQALKIQVAEKLIAPAQTVISLSKFDGQKINEGYTNLASVVTELTKLQLLHDNIFSHVDYLSDIAATTLRLISDLKEIKVQIETNLLNREVQAHQQNLFYADAVLDSFDTSPEVQAVRATDTVAAAMLHEDTATVTTTQIEEAQQQAISLLSSLAIPQTMFGAIPISVIENTVRSPIRGFRHFLSILNSRIGDTVIAKFVDDFNVVEFVRDLLDPQHTSALTLDDRKKIIQAYKILLATRSSQLHSNTTLSHLQVQRKLQTVIAEAKRNKDEGRSSIPAPSPAQERVITELAFFLSSTKQTTTKRGLTFVGQFQNVAALKAPPGAGKSVLVTPLTFSVLGYTPDNILTAANLQPAANVIKSSTGSSYPAHTHQELFTRLQAGNIPAEVKTIVLDEAGSMDPVDLYKVVGAFTEFLNNHQDRNIKLLLIYDPNQVNRSAWGTPRIEQESFSIPVGYNDTTDPNTLLRYETGQMPLMGSELPWIQNVTDITPLSATYRSDVGEIIDLITAFTTSEKVTTIHTASITDPITNMQGNLGTYSENSPSNLLRILKNSVTSNPSRSFAVIVGTEAKKLAYLQDLHNAGITAPVYTVEESSGISVDEAYVDLEYVDDVRFTPYPKLYNQYIRTAISRARKFAYVSSYQTNHTLDDTIPQKVELNQKLNESRYESALQEKAARIAILQPSNQTPVATPTITTPPVAVAPPEEQAGEELPFEMGTAEAPIEEAEPVLPLEDIIINEENPVMLPLSQDAYPLVHPQSEAFTDIGPFPAIKAGDEVLVIKQVTGSQERYIIAQQVGSNKLRLIGVIGDLELQAFKTKFNIPDLVAATLTPDLLSDTTGKNIFKTTQDVSTINSVKLKVAQGSTDIQYHYANHVTTDFGTTGVQELVSRWASSMFQDPTSQLDNYDDVIENWDKYVEFRIFRKAQDIQREFPGVDNPDSLLNKPLMVIKGVKSSAGRVIRSQFIELRPTILSQNSEAAKQIGLHHVYTFLNTLNDFTSLITTQQWPSGIYNNMDLGMSIKLSEADVYYPFHKFVQALAQGRQGRPIIVASNALKDRLRAVDPALVLEDINYDDVNPRIIELAQTLYDLAHGDAQKAFDSIAATNLLVTLPSGKTKILRDYTTNVLEQRNGRVTRSQNVIGGLSLLGPLTFEHNNGRSYNSLIKPQLMDSLQAHLQRSYLRSTGKNLPIEQITQQSDLNTRQKFVASILMDAANPSMSLHLAPLTSSDLRELFVDSVDNSGKFSKVSEGFGLRTPLSLYAFSPAFSARADQSGHVRSARDLSLHSFVETSFSGVSPTTIGLTTADVNASLPINVPTEVPTTTNDYTTIRQMHEDGYTLEDIASAVPSVEFNSIQQYIASLNESSVYATRITAITKLVANQMQRVSPGTASKLEDIFFESKYAKDFEKTGSRDYVRAALLAIVLPEAYADSPFHIIDQARTFVRTEGDFHEANEWLERTAQTYGVTNVEQRIADLQTAAAEIASKYGLTFTKTEGYHAIQGIVALSSQFRTLERAGTLERISDVDINTSFLVLEQLRDAVLSADFVKFKALQVTDEFQALPLDIDLSSIQTAEDLETNPSLIRTINDAITELGIERSMRYEGDNQDIGQELTDAEVAKLVSRINPPNLRSFLKDLFRTKPQTETYRIVTAAYMQYALGRNNWGLFKDGLMYFSRSNKGGVGASVVTHELFHRVFWNYLTKEEQVRALDLAKQKYGDLPVIDLEERLATEFSNFNPKKRSALRRIFERILRFLNFSYNNMRSLEDFFDSISSGFYTGNGHGTTGVERAYPILREFGTIDNYLISKRIFLDTFDSIYNSGRNSDKAVSYEEAVESTLSTIKAYVANPTHTFGLEEDIAVVKSALSKLLSRNGKAAKFFIESFFYATDVAKVVELKRKERLALSEDIANLRSRLELLESKLENEGVLASDEAEERDALNDSINEAESLLSEETFDVELQDPRSKLTSRVKQRLVSIRYSDKGKVKYAEFGKAYNVLIQLASQADTSSLEAFKESVRQRVNAIGKSLITDNTGYHTSVRKAVAAFMFDTLDALELANKTKLSNVAFFKDANFKEEYMVVSFDGSNVHSITKSEASKNPARYEVIPRVTGQTMDAFISSVATRYNLDKKALVNNYYLHEDMNFLRSLIAATTSLRKSNPHTAREVYRNYKYRAFYSASRKGGTAAATESQMAYSFSSYVDSLPANSPLFPASITGPLQSAKTFDEKRGVLSAFVRLLGFRGIPADATAEDITKAFSHLQRAIPSLSANYKVDAVEAFANEASLVDSLVSMLGTTGSYVDITSYIRGDGKRAYTWIDASFQSALLQAIVNPLKTTTFPHLQIDKGRLTTSVALLKDNIFVNNNFPAAKILGYVDHDSIRKTWVSKYLHSETLEDFHQRNFIFGFVANVANGNYVQFLPIPSNRRSIQGVRVNTLSIAEAKRAIDTILTAQKNRPEATGPYANVVQYAKNRNKITFPGLESNDTSSNAEMLSKIEQHINEQSEKALADMARMLVSSTGSPRLDDAQIEKAASALGVTLKSFVPTQRFQQQITDLNKKKREGTIDPAILDQQIEDLKTQRKQLLNEQLVPLFKIFYYNYIVNNYSLSQLIYGDETMYKGKEDETKRIQIATATGDVLLTDKEFGLPEKTLVGVLEDMEPSINLDLHGISPSSFRQSFKETDAQGYMLPEAYELFARTYGIESDLDVTMKPVYFALDEHGVPRSIKYSAIILTDELVEQYKDLGTLRDKMRKGVNGRRIDQTVFRSAIKMGAPLKGLSASDALSSDTEFSSEHTMDTDSKFYRIQLNPAKSPEVTVSNPSQITAFMNTNGKNTPQISELHRLNAMVISLGSKGLSRELQLSEKGTLTRGSFNTLRKRLVSTLERISGSEDVAEALSSVDENGRYSVSFNLPLIQEKVVASIASIISASTVSFRFPGSKLVLQSPFGTLLQNEKLAFKDKDGYTEVMLPESYRAFISVGSTFTVGNKDGIVGFRIPSTNYHSALALKVKGFYPVPAGSEGNIIIAPAEIVFFHGSDYDIDTLFLIRKKAATESVDISGILGQYFQDAPQISPIEKGEVVGTKEDGSPTLYEGRTLHDYLNKYISAIDSRIRQIRKEYLATTNLESRQALALQLDAMETDFYSLIDVAMTSAQNNIVYLLSSNLREEHNRTDLLTPISFDRVSSSSQTLRAELQDALEDEQFINELIKLEILKKECE